MIVNVGLRRTLCGEVGGAYGTLAETSTLLAAFPTPASAPRQTLINDTIYKLIAFGIWSKLDLLYMLATAAQDQAVFNWKAPGTNTLTENNSPTFVANSGYTGDGISMSLTAAYTNSQYTQNNSHVSAFTITNSTNSSSDVGITNVTPAIRGRVRTRNTTAAGASAGTSTQSLATTGATVPLLCAGNRNSDASNQTVWVNGALDTTAAVASLATTATLITILGDGLGNFADRKISFVSAGASLTAAQHYALNFIVREHLAGVGAI